MTWAFETREAFIWGRLAAGRVNRRDVVEAFKVSALTATADFNRFQSRHPGAMRYDTSAKAYVPGPNFAHPVFDLQEDLDKLASAILEFEAADSDGRTINVGQPGKFAAVMRRVLVYAFPGGNTEPTGADFPSPLRATRIYQAGA